MFDGVLGKEVKVPLHCKTLQEVSSRNQESPISETINSMKSRMGIAIVRGKPHIYASKDNTHSRLDEYANIPKGKIEPASAYQ